MNLADKSKAIAYADIVLLTLGIVLASIFSLVFAFEYDPDKKNSSEIRLLFVGLQIRFVVGGIIQLASIYLILEGVLLRIHNPLKVWTLVTKVFLGLMLISGVVKLIMNPIFVILELIGCAYKGLGLTLPLAEKMKDRGYKMKENVKVKVWKENT